jgi:hypothetical protein
VLRVDEIDRPMLDPDEILVEIRAAVVNPTDAERRNRGTDPAPKTTDSDFVGVVSVPPCGPELPAETTRGRLSTLVRGPRRNRSAVGATRTLVRRNAFEIAERRPSRLAGTVRPGRSAWSGTGHRLLRTYGCNTTAVPDGADPASGREYEADREERRTAGGYE